MMQTSNTRTLLILALIGVAGWGLYRVVADWGASVPRPANAATQVLGYPYIADRGSGLLHKRRCGHLSPQQSFAPDPRDLKGYESRGEALADGYDPCEDCNP